MPVDCVGELKPQVQILAKHADRNVFDQRMINRFGITQGSFGRLPLSEFVFELFVQPRVLVHQFRKILERRQHDLEHAFLPDVNIECLATKPHLPLDALLRGRGTAEREAHGVENSRLVGRLRHVSVRAGFQTAQNIGHIARTGQHEYRDVDRVFPEFEAMAEFGSAHSRQRQVGHHQIEA